MPITIEVVKTPAGHDVIRSVNHGKVTGEDMTGLLQAFAKPDSPHFGLPLLSIIPSDSELTSQAKAVIKEYQTPSPQQGAPMVTAVVIEAVVMRAMIGFMLKVAQVVNPTNPMRAFDDERDAVAWLDTQLSKAA